MNENSTVRIIAIPFAGGNEYSFRNFENLLPANYKWHTVELPGRGSRINEDYIQDVDRLIEDIFHRIRELLVLDDYIIYGHSMGGLLCYELTKKIMEMKIKKPLYLYITGKNAPSNKLNKNISTLNSTLFWEEIHKMGGMPEEVMTNRDFKDFLEPILRSDFKLIENYNYTSLDSPLPIPIYLRIGDAENTTKAQLNDWQNETSVPINIETFPGNHFFIFEHSEVIVEEIRSLSRHFCSLTR